MNILFVHQNFPGQYIHIARALARQGGHQIVALGLNQKPNNIPEGVTYICYSINTINTTGIHKLVAETESKVIRGEACARAASQLKGQGFIPDVICAHPGWGEALFLPDVWPNSPILAYQEFFYHTYGLDTDFDPELQSCRTLDQLSKIRMKNAYLHLTLDSSYWNVTPTDFQRSTFPSRFQSSISAIHDGIDVRRASPSDKISSLLLPDQTKLTKGERIVTFVNAS